MVEESKREEQDDEYYSPDHSAADRETFGQAGGHGQETGHNRRCYASASRIGAGTPHFSGRRMTGNGGPGVLVLGGEVRRGDDGGSGPVRLREALDRLIEWSTATNKPDEVKKRQAERAKYPAEQAPPPREEK